VYSYHVVTGSHSEARSVLRLQQVRGLSSDLLAVLLQIHLDCCIDKVLDPSVSEIGPGLDEPLHQLEEPGVELDVSRHVDNIEEGRHYICYANFSYYVVTPEYKARARIEKQDVSRSLWNRNRGRE